MNFAKPYYVEFGSGNVVFCVSVMLLLGAW